MVWQKNGGNMRTVFVGAGKVSTETAKVLIKKNHEVVIIETDKARIEELSEEMDCSFLQGDATQPNILREVNPEHTDFLFCLTSSDQANVIASLVGRSLGFKRIVTSIGDPFHHAQSAVTWRTWLAAAKMSNFQRSSKMKLDFSP
jgi:trk system potassium uptake protein TrkA